MSDDLIYLEQEQIDRFWSKVDKITACGPNGDCWAWTAGIKTSGESGDYGGFYIKQINNTKTCHKLAFCIYHNFAINEIPENIVIRHKCNNSICCNPKHLLLGTYKDNSEDMVKAGNSQKGTCNTKSKLDEQKVKEIREKWSTGKYKKSWLAKEYSISTSVIWHVVQNITWKDDSYNPVFLDDSHNHQWKIPQETVENIKRRFTNGESAISLAAEYLISLSQTYNIIRGRQRKEVINEIHVGA